jgi:hypothetical protein
MSRSTFVVVVLLLASGCDEPPPPAPTARAPHVPPVPAPRPASGGFALASTPAGAMVRVDGKDLGSTPIRLTDLPPGNHGIRLTRSRRVARLEVRAAHDVRQQADATRALAWAFHPALVPQLP